MTKRYNVIVIKDNPAEVDKAVSEGKWVLTFDANQVYHDELGLEILDAVFRGDIKR